VRLAELEVADGLGGEAARGHEWREAVDGGRGCAAGGKYCRSNAEGSDCPGTHNALPVSESTMTEAVLFKHKPAGTTRHELERFV
jgi:hypothetical protein